MRSKILTSLLGFTAALALAAPAAASVTGFRLPPSGGAAPQQPERQGPVVPDVPQSRGPAPTPTPAPPRQATPAPSPTPTLAPPPATRTAPLGRPTRAVQGSAAPSSAPAPADQPPPETTGSALDSVPQALPTTAAPPPAPAAVETDSGGASWPWLLAGLLALGALGAGARLWLRRRREPGIPTTVPQVERPRLTPAPAPEPVAEPLPEADLIPAPVFNPAAAAGEPLQITLEPLRMSLTLLNASLSWRLKIVNRGPTPLSGLSVGADMISAHASMTREEQLAGPGEGGAPVQRIERIEPGESRIVEGEFKVPFTQIVPIRQGNAALLLPLARFRVAAAAAEPVVRTFVVGQPGQGKRLQPFRLDQGPRVYPTLMQHAFA